MKRFVKSIAAVSGKKLRHVLRAEAFHPRYPEYMAWSFVSNVLVATESVLGTHSMLATVGKESTEMAVSFNYIGKDVLGQLGGLYYMYRTSRKVDSQPKKFMNRSMVIQQASILLECATPLLSRQLFLPTAAIANVGKNVSFTGFGAINAKSIQALANGNSVGELYTKLTAVNTLASSIGMGIGLYIAAKIPDHTQRLALVPLITGARFFTFKKAMSCVINKIE